MTSRVAIILPPREGFSPQAFGAVSLSIRDFTQHSTLRDSLSIYGGRSEPPFAGMPYHACDMSRPWYLRPRARYLAALKPQLQSLAPGLIEVHNRPVLAKKIAAWKLAPVSLFLHNDPRAMEAANTSAKRHALQTELAGILHVSDYIKQCWLQGVQDNGAHHVCPLGIALPETPMAKKQQILFVGRMVPEKGVHVAAEALLQCLPAAPTWQGVFVGGKRFAAEALSPYEQEVQKTLQPVWPQINWRGFQDHAATMQAFAEASIVLIPSLWEEPFGRIAIEAMAHGCAVVTSGRGGLAEIVGDDAVIPTPFSSATLAEALSHLMADHHFLAQLQARAKNRAAQFDISSATRHLDSVRTSLMSPAA